MVNASTWTFVALTEDSIWQPHAVIHKVSIMNMKIEKCTATLIII